MKDTRQIPVFGRDGQLGWLEPHSRSAQGRDLLLRLEDGAVVQIPSDIIVKQADGSYYLPMSLDQLKAQPGETHESHQHTTIPVIVEEPVVGKKRTERRVRIHKVVNEHDEIIDEPGFREHVDIQRVPVNQVVTAPPAIRYEGETMIIPVLEEVLVVEKRLVLKEEVHVTRHKETVHDPKKVTLRAEEVQVERLDPQDDKS